MRGVALAAGRKKIIGLLLFWILAWIFFRGINGVVNPWLSLGIAISMFIIPGIGIYLLLVENVFSLESFLSGLSISILMTAVLGLLARTMHFPFTYVYYGVMVGGAAAWSAFLVRNQTIHFHVQIDWESILMGWPAYAGIVLAVLYSMHGIWESDDYTYLAYVTKWQHSTGLNFNEIIFGLNYTEDPRFWPMMLPMSYAILSELSGIHGILLLGTYLRLFLVILALLSTFYVARKIDMAPTVASFAVLAQVALLIGLTADRYQAGTTFFFRIQQDKATVAFLLAPIFLGSITRLLAKPNRSSVALTLMTGFTLTMTHPVMLTYTIIIAGLFGFLDFLKSRNWKPLIIMAIVLFIILAPAASLRFIDTWATYHPFSLEETAGRPGMTARINIIGDRFYGFDLSSLKSYVPGNIPGHDFIAWAWLIIPVLTTIYGIRKLEQSITARYALSGLLLILLTGIPFTGWLIGYFVSAPMLWRSVFMYPFGITTAFVLSALIESNKRTQLIQHVVHRLPPYVQQHGTSIILNCAAIFFLVYAANVMEWQHIPSLLDFDRRVREYRVLVEVGQELDYHMNDQQIVTGNNLINDFLPGLSANARVVQMRGLRMTINYGVPRQIARRRVADMIKLFTPKTTEAERMAILKRNKIRLIVLNKVAEDEVNFFASHPSRFVLIHRWNWNEDSQILLFLVIDNNKTSSLRK